MRTKFQGVLFELWQLTAPFALWSCFILGSDSLGWRWFEFQLSFCQAVNGDTVFTWLQFFALPIFLLHLMMRSSWKSKPLGDVCKCCGGSGIADDTYERDGKIYNFGNHCPRCGGVGNWSGIEPGTYRGHSK